MISDTPFSEEGSNSPTESVHIASGHEQEPVQQEIIPEETVQQETISEEPVPASKVKVGAFGGFAAQPKPNAGTGIFSAKDSSAPQSSSASNPNVVLNQPMQAQTAPAGGGFFSPTTNQPMQAQTASAPAGGGFFGQAPMQAQQFAPGPFSGFQEASIPQGGDIPNEADYIGEVSLDEDLTFYVLDKFPEMAVGDVARVAVVTFRMEKGNYVPRVRMAETYFKVLEGKQCSWVAPKEGSPLRKQCFARYGDSKKRFGIILLKYDTDRFGQLTPDAGYKLYGYTFSRTQWLQLQSIHREWGLQSCDLIMRCTNSGDFRTHSFEHAKGCYWQQVEESIQKEIMDQAVNLYQDHLGKLVGRVRTEEELALIMRGMNPDLRREAAQQMQPRGPAGGDFSGYVMNRRM
jgi:hypothetical protein